MPRQIEIEGRKVFDRRVSIRDPKTGKTIKEQPFTEQISQSHGTIIRDANGVYNALGEDIKDPQAPQEDNQTLAKTGNLTPKIVLKN